MVFHLVGLHLCLLYLLTNFELTKVVVAPVSSKAFSVKDSLDFCFLANVIKTIELRFCLGFLRGRLPTRRSLRVNCSLITSLVKHSKFSSGHTFQPLLSDSEELSSPSPLESL